MTPTALRMPACPSWCAVAPFPGPHPAHWGLAAEWEGPGPLLVEVGIVERRDGTRRVVVEVETFDQDGATVEHTITRYTPAEALTEARHGEGPFAAALATAVQQLGAQEVNR